MKADFIQFSIYLETVKSLDIISFKKLYNKKLSTFLLTGTENATEELFSMQKSYNKFFNSKNQVA